MLDHLIGLRREPDRALTTAFLPLRLFLGATFVYAALDKLTDPAFFDPGAPTSIGQQMAGYVRSGSPAVVGMLRPSVAHRPARVYVPNSEDGTIDVINPATFRLSPAASSS